MTVWLFEGALGVGLFVVLLPLVLVPLVFQHYRRHRHFNSWPALLTAGTFLYACGLLAFTFFPVPDASEYCGIEERSSSWQLTPLESVGDVLDRVATSGMSATLTSGVFLQLLFNVLLLVPLGFLLAYRYRKGPGITVLVGLGLSLLIESTQGTGVWGIYECPYRLADVDDLLTNTTGALVGWAVGRAFANRLPDPDPPPGHDWDPPTLFRRMFAGLLDVLLLVVVGIAIQIPLVVIASLVSDDTFADEPWFGVLSILLGTAFVAVGLFLAIPLSRKDGATPGQWATWLAVADADHPEPSQKAATPRQLVVRFGVRWLVIIAAAFASASLYALLLVAIVEIGTVMARDDRKSASGWISGTVTTTRRSPENADRIRT